MAGVQLWETLKESIVAYTGLSPTTFFAILALLFAVYYVLSGLFGYSSSDLHPQTRNFQEEELPPLRPPVQLGEITEEELKAYDGNDHDKPLLMAIKGQIYDVSQSRMFYGPGGPYALFAGKDASRALAKMSFDEKDLTGDISGLGPFELDALQDWEYKFMEKYVKVGTIKKEATEAESTGEPSGSTPRDVDVINPTEDGRSKPAAVKSEETPSNVEADKE
uniref:Cytochrome b5 heme-binding domain-containing protein n=1 Tax=Medicago truncatula TaxID=3880 RepID=B7FKZ6_MEDTR|nr:unknown [Medicago truncatula]AFK47952.1 unknown [Medicago truncatula]